MRKNSLLLFLALVAMQFSVLAERINIPGLGIPKLVITEVRPDAEATAYIEITNMGDTAINLAPFTIHSVHSNTRPTAYSDSVISFNRSVAATDATIGKVYLKGILQPGESYLVASVWDTDNVRKSGIPFHNIALAQIGKQFVHKSETNNLNGWINKPEWQCFGFDSISTRQEQLRAESSAGYLIHWKYTNEAGTLDSTYIDQFNFFYYPDETGSIKGNQIFSIAGVNDAMTTSVMVRKSNVNKGNLNWNSSRGTDVFTSEWLVIPKNTSKNMAFSTAGVHGNYPLSYSVKDPSKIVLDNTAKTISIPWQMERGDSLARYFNIATGMAWSYSQNPIFADSASYIARNGDKFALYSVGETLNKVDFTLQVRDAEPNLAVVFPRRSLTEVITLVPNSVTGKNDTLISFRWPTGFRYALSQGVEIDSIINIPFATRVDSLLKYLDKPEKAKWEIVFADGQNRVDLMFGDKLKVTSENGNVEKLYFLALSEYVKNNNALLSTVTWPDIDLNQYPRWNKGDTLPDFDPLKSQYIIDLAYDAKQIPALQFITQNSRAKINVTNASNINGTPEQRTTTVVVTSESDTVTLSYKFEFRKQGVPVQPNRAEPFISEIISNVTTGGFAMEIYNPGSEDLDLSRYMLVRGSKAQTWQEAVKTLIGTAPANYANGLGQPTPELKIYQTHYVPSKRWAADGSPEAWAATPTVENPFVGRGFLKDDNQTDPWVKGNDVFVMSAAYNTPVQQTKIRQESDFIFRGNDVDNTKYAWPNTLLLHRTTPVWISTVDNVWLLKVLNDSILDGTKSVAISEADYELIDRFEVDGNLVAGRAGNSGANTFIRKPSVNKGTLERIGGTLETAESSEWILNKVGDPGWTFDMGVSNIGIHTMTPVTNFLSTVTSVKFIVTPGYSGDELTIKGNITDYTPTSIALLIDKADASQSFEFKRASTPLADNETLAAGDVLEVTSGDGRSVTIYTLVNSPLDNNTSLLAKAGSGLTVTGNKITGVSAGSKLKDAIAQLEVAEKSVLNIYNANGALQTLKALTVDAQIVDVLVSEGLVLEVVAENDDKATYSFDFALANNTAILMSNVLDIDQDKKIINNLPATATSSSLLSMVFANQGATIKIFDKAGFERVIGFINVDDVVVVTAPDGVTKSTYKLSEEAANSVFNLKDNSGLSFVIYPNPVSSTLNISGIELRSAKVYSLTGLLLISEFGMYSNRLNVSMLQNGVYVLEMTDKDGKKVVDKFLKK